MIALHAWPGGLAIVVEGAEHRAVAVFGLDGWRRGEPRVVFPDGPPPGTQSYTLTAPDWLADQLAPLELSLGGVHTDFIRLDRLLSRLQAQAANGAVLVLGPRPAVIALTDGRLQVIEPLVPAGAPALPIVAGSDGWVLVFTGRVSVPAAPLAASEEPAAPAETVVATPEPVLAAASEGQADPSQPVDRSRSEDTAPALEAVPPTAPAPAAVAHAEERFVASPGIVRSMPDEVAAEITTAAGEDALAAVALLDGSRTVAEVAESLGLSSDQVLRVVRLLVGRKLAFRYVSRVRPATGVKASG